MRKLFVLFVAQLLVLTCMKAEELPHPFKAVDISKACNMGFRDDFGGDKKGGWTDQGQLDIREFSPGIKKFNGISFDIINPAENNGKSCIVLRNNRKGKEFLPLDTKQISVDSKAAAMYFICASAWNAAIGEEIAKVIVNYDRKGLFSEISFKYGENIADWYHPKNIPLADICWKRDIANRPSVGLYCYGWKNPYPKRKITSIKFISNNTGAIPAFVAVSLIKSAPASEHYLKVLTEKLKTFQNRNKKITSAKLSVDFGKKKAAVCPQLCSLASTGTSSKRFSNLITAMSEADTKKPFYRYQLCRRGPSVAKGKMDFTALNQVIDYMIATGTEPMLCIGPNGPKWMNSENRIDLRQEHHWRPRDIEEYAEYCASLVRYYKERGTPVKWWEITNEMETGWSYPFLIKVYTAAAKKMKKVDPNIKLGGLACCSMNFGLLKEFVKKVPANLIDFITFHEYGYQEPFNTPTSYIMRLTTRFYSHTKVLRKFLKQKFKRHIPIIVTETNISPRWDGGVDPKIGTIVNAAWYTSIAGNFAKAGGDALCYFTFTGGFGACKTLQENVKIRPVYHSMWLCRKFLQGKFVSANSDTKTVEIFATAKQKNYYLTIVNKNANSVKINLSLNKNKMFIQGNKYILNAETASKISLLKDKNERVPLLNPIEFSIDKNMIIEFEMKPFEVRALSIQ